MKFPQPSCVKEELQWRTLPEGQAHSCATRLLCPPAARPRFIQFSWSIFRRCMNYNNRCLTVQKDPNKQFQRRIFGFAPHAEPARLHVGKHVLHDLSKIGSTESVIAQIVTVAPEKIQSKTLSLCLIWRNIKWI